MRKARKATRAAAGAALVSAVLFAALACGPGEEPPATELSGTYEGTTEDGRPMRLELSQEGMGVRGHGVVDGEPVVVAGALACSAAVTLTATDGSVQALSLTPSGGGARLSVAHGEREIGLDRTAASPTPGAGPFAGRYEASGPAGIIAELHLVQHSSLLAGSGRVFERPVGVSGRVTGTDRATGEVTFSDASTLRFEARRESDGSIVLTGLGEPIALEPM